MGTDNMSKIKAESFSNIDDVMHEIPRAREVGQNWFTSLFYTIYAFMKILPLVLNFQPQLLLVNGPGTCVPVVLATWLFSLLRFIRIGLKLFLLKAFVVSKVCHC